MNMSYENEYSGIDNTWLRKENQKRSAETTSLENWMYDWLSLTSIGYSETTYAKYKQIIACYIVPYFKDALLVNIDENCVQDFYVTLGSEGRNLSSHTVHLIASVLNESMSYACGTQIMPYNPCSLCYIHKRSYTYSEPLNDKAIKEILKCSYHNIYENFFALLLVSAVRFSELAGLSWQDVDAENGAIHIRRKLQTFYSDGCIQRKIRSIENNNAVRAIVLPPFAFQYLTDERKKQEIRRDRAGSLWKNTNNLVFTTETGSPIPYYKVLRRFKKIVLSLGQPDANLNTLRHTGATIAFAATNNLATVRTMTGLSSTGTANRYVHSMQQMNRRFP